jgi:hypothetical protein
MPLIKRGVGFISYAQVLGSIDNALIELEYRVGIFLQEGGDLIDIGIEAHAKE